MENINEKPVWLIHGRGCDLANRISEGGTIGRSSLFAR